MAEPGFRRLAIIGLGLIGGSVAAAVKRQNPAAAVVAWDKDAGSLKAGRDLGLIDETAGSAGEAAAGADLVLLAVPVQSMRQVFAGITLQGQVLTDVGSVKGAVIAAAKDAFGAVPEKFVPGHPIAGSEKQGVAAADPCLFHRHRVILTPVASAGSDATGRVADWWRGLGAEVVTMSPERHDRILAQTSHLPHLLAYALVDILSADGDQMEVFQYAGGGFRDFSRIAASDPDIWSDIFQANGAAVIRVLDRYLEALTGLKRMLEAGDADALKAVFRRAKAARDYFSTIDPTGGPDG